MIGCVFLPDVVGMVEHSLNRSSNRQLILIDSKGKVQAASLKAVRSGVRLGMSYRKAKGLCLDAEILSFEETPYREMSESVVSILAEFSNRIEAAAAFWQFNHKSRKQQSSHPSAFTYFLDFGKLRAHDAVSLAGKLIKALNETLQLTAAVGLAESKFTAQVAARHSAFGRVKLIRSGEEKQYLAPFTVTLLPLSKELSRRLKLLGIHTMSDFAALPTGAVFSQFGKPGRIIQDLASGIDRRPVLPPPVTPVETIVQHFDGAVEDRQQLETALRLLGCEVERRLQSRGYALRTLKVIFNLDDGSTPQIDYTCRRPTSSGQHIGRLLAHLLSKRALTSGIVRIEITIGELVPQVWQQLELFAVPRTGEMLLQEMLDNLTARFGSGNLFQIDSSNRSHRLLERRFRFADVEAL